MSIPAPRIDDIALAIWRGQIQSPRAETIRQHRLGQAGDIIQATGTIMPVDSHIEATNWATDRGTAYAAAAAVEALEGQVVAVVDGHDVLWPSVLVAEVHTQIIKTAATDSKRTETGAAVRVTHRIDFRVTLRAQTGPQI